MDGLLLIKFELYELPWQFHILQ